MSKNNKSNNKKEKYVAMIVERQYLSEDTYLFKPHHIALGKFIEDKELFVDMNENEYSRISNEDCLTSETPYAYVMLEKLSNIKNIIKLDNIPMKTMISEYDWCCRNFIFLVGYLEDGQGFYRAINVADLKKDIKKSYELEPDEDPADELIAEGKDEEEVIKDITGDEDEEIVTKPIADNLERILLNMLDGKYSEEKLKELRERLIEKKEDYETAADSVELQIEAMHDKKNLDDLIKYLEIKSHPENLPITIHNIPKSPKPKEIKKEETKKEEKPSNPYKEKFDIEKLYKDVTKTLIAQDEPVRRVIVELARKEIDERKKREGILLTGPTGVGKTKLMSLIAKYTNKPFIIVDTTQLTVPGYVGKDIEQVLYDLYKQCGFDKEKTERAIIYFDEIDKKGSSKKSDVSGQGVLNVLLPFIEGSTYDAKGDKIDKGSVKINTSNMTVIFGGAFTDVYKNLKKQNEIGFTGEQTSLSKPVYREAETNDFVEYGLMTNEFMGRVTVIKLNDLDLQDIKRIILESDESQLKIQEKIFKEIGVKIKFTDEYINAVAEKAYAKKTGARAINGIVDDTTWKAFEKIYSSDGEYEEVILDEKTLEDNSNYQLIKKKDKN